MNNLLTHTNERYSVLCESSAFLQLILNNMKTCVMLLDKKLQLRAINNPANTIFANLSKQKKDFQECGELIRCAHLLDEDSPCGSTSNCRSCELRILALQSYAENQPISNKPVLKPIINIKGERVEKHLLFSTKLVRFRDEKYLLALIDDITELKKSDII